MHYGIVTTDNSDHFLIFLISEELILGSTNKPINDKYVAYFETLRSSVLLETCVEQKFPK